MAGGDIKEGEDAAGDKATLPATPPAMPYAIELWGLTRAGPERIIGRATSVVLARAIFVAAQSQHLGRKIVLRRGAEVLAESD